MKREPSQVSSVDSIPGIGRKRSEALSTLGIHTIADFLERTTTGDGRAVIGQELRISERMVIHLMQMALGQVGNKHPLQSPFDSTLFVAFIVMGLGILLIVGGALVAGISFHESRWPTFSLILLENNEIERPAFSWIVRGESMLKKSGKTYTRIVIEPDWRDGFSSDFPKSLPEGVFIPYLMRSTTVKSVSAKLWLVETGIRTVEGPWVQSVDLEKKKIEIPTIVKNVSHYENYPGINFIAHLNTKSTPRNLERNQRVDFSLEVEFEDDGFDRPLHRYTGGLVAVRVFLAASVNRYLGIKKRKWGKHELLGSFVELQETPDRVERVEYTWRSELAGEFSSPDEMIGAKQFWEDGRNRVEGSFVFKASGLKWLSYIGAIVGLPMLMGGGTLARQRWSRPKHPSIRIRRGRETHET